MKTYTDVLDETVRYYKTHSRGTVYTDGTGPCVYYEEDEDEDGGCRMCAIGRLLENPEAASDVIGPWAGYDGNTAVLRATQIKEEYQHLSHRFLAALQIFHDTDSNWTQNETGGWDLTAQGLDELDRLKDIWGSK